jgi:hypothetical protein
MEPGSAGELIAGSFIAPIYRNPAAGFVVIDSGPMQ